MTMSDRYHPPRELVSILGIPFDNLDMEEVVDRIEGFVLSGKPHYVATANLNFVAMAYRDPEFMEVVRIADLITPDGMPILWGARLLGYRLKERVTGADLVPRLAELAAERGYTIFFLGGAPGVGEQAVRNLRKRLGKIKAFNYSPEFNPLLEMGNTKILAKIREAEPDILFVSFGAGKAEKWIRMNLPSLNVPVCIGVGATVDFVAGRVPRAPQWMRSSGLEWLYRLLQEPRRLFRRYFTDVWPFAFHFSRQWLANMRRKLFSGRKGQLRRKSQLEAVVLRIEGRLDNATAPGLQNDGEALLRAKQQFIVDLSSASFIDSRGLGVLTVLEKQARSLQSSIPMVRPGGSAGDIFRLNKLDSFLALYEDLYDARQAAAAQPGKDLGAGKVQGGTVTYTPEGRLDAEQSAKFKRELFVLIDANPQAGVVEINLGNVSFMDSSGLTVLILAYKKLLRESRELSLVNITSQVVQIFKVMKMESYLGNSIKS